jgi:hypothetical protein
MPASAERRTVSREAAHGTGVESSSLSRSQKLGESRARTLIASSSCGAKARSRLLNPDWPGM